MPLKNGEVYKCPKKDCGCEVAGRFQKIMFWASVIIYSIGLFAAYGLLPLLQLFE